MILTGIGSRKRPTYIREIILDVMTNLSPMSTLRSGAAYGCDSDFEELAKSKEIYLPWAGFNKSKSELYLSNINNLVKDYYLSNVGLVEYADKIIQNVHPSYNRLSLAGKKLHTRNVFQVLGITLDKPSDLLICYTENGVTKGGTATAINIAKEFQVPVLNIGRLEDLLVLVDVGLCSKDMLNKVIHNYG